MMLDDILNKILNQKVHLQDAGYFPDTVACSEETFRDLVWRAREEEGWIVSRNDTVFGLRIKVVNRDLPSKFMVYQTGTKTDPEWPSAYLRQLAVNSLEKP